MKKSVFQTVVVGIAVVLLIGLGVTVVLLTRHPDEPTIGSRGECSAPSIDWMTISNNVDHQVLAGLASQLAVAATNDAEMLKKLASAKINGDFKTSLKDVSMEAIQSQKTVSVTQEFFQKATAYRMAVCNLERQIAHHVITSPKALEEAQLQLLQLSSDFAKIGQEQTKQMETMNTQQHFDIINGAYQGKTVRIKSKSPGVYELEADLLAGDCVMRKGSTLVFGSDGVARFTLYVRTKHTTNRDIWHQTWQLEDGQQFGSFDSPDLHENEPEKKWEGSFQFKGNVPSGLITWDCGC